MASVAAGYLPILLFLIVALGLSAGFVILPMIVSRFLAADATQIEARQVANSVPIRVASALVLS